VPVSDPKLSERLAQIFDILLADDVLAWSLGPDGVWQKVPSVNGLNSHKRFQELALESARGNGIVNGVVNGVVNRVVTTVPHARA
jgi:polyphosphate kinase